MAEQVKLGEISSFGELIPIGQEFDAKAMAIEVKTTEMKTDGTGGGKHYLSVKWRVLNGEYEGIEYSVAYWLGITKSPKNQKYYGRDVSKLQAEMDAIKKPLPKDVTFPMKGDETTDDMKRVAKLLFERINPNATPRVRFKTVGEKMQKKEAGTEKWVDDLDDTTGKVKLRTSYYIVGLGGAAPVSAPAGAQAAEGVASTDADPLKFL